MNATDNLAPRSTDDCAWCGHARDKHIGCGVPWHTHEGAATSCEHDNDCRCLAFVERAVAS